MLIESLQEMLLWNPPKIKEYIESSILLESTKLVIYGAPKTFKSLLAQQLAFSFATQTDWLDLKVGRAKVLYVQGEIGRIPFYHRVKSMSKNFVVQPSMLYFTTAFGYKLDKPDGRDTILKTIDKLKPAITIIDPLYKFISGPQEDNILRFTDTVDELINSFGQSLVLIHHSRKERTTTSGAVIDLGGSEVRGPIIEQWADSLIRVKGDTNTDERILDFELRHAATFVAPMGIKLDRNNTTFRRM
jgi:RecA-family ATPase